MTLLLSSLGTGNRCFKMQEILQPGEYRIKTIRGCVILFKAQHEYLRMCRQSTFDKSP